MSSKYFDQVVVTPKAKRKGEDIFILQDLLKKTLLELTDEAIFPAPKGVDPVEHLLENWTVDLLTSRLAWLLIDKGIQLPISQTLDKECHCDARSDNECTC